MPAVVFTATMGRPGLEDLFSPSYCSTVPPQATTMLVALAVSMALPPPRATSSCTCRVRAAAMQSFTTCTVGLGCTL